MFRASREGTIGHFSFRHTNRLVRWIEEKQGKDWNDEEKLDFLCDEYIESSSIRLNVTLRPPNEASIGEEESLNSCLLDTFEPVDIEGAEWSLLNPFSSLSILSRQISLNIRPITPVILACPYCGPVLLCTDVSSFHCWSNRNNARQHERKREYGVNEQSSPLRNVRSVPTQFIARTSTLSG